MKNLLLIVAILFSGMLVKAQDIFFPTEEGTVLVYNNFDKKEKVTGVVRYTITNVKKMGENLDITYLIESMDPKEQPVFKEEITIHKIGDKLFVDMSNYMNKAAFQQNGSIPAEIQIKGNDMELPSNPKAGDVLPDANVEMAMKIGFINIKMSAKVTERKVESVEPINLKAGTFNAYKFSSNVSAVVLGMKSNSKTTEWYAKGVGMIKSESYDKNGKLSSYTELVELRK